MSKLLSRKGPKAVAAVLVRLYQLPVHRKVSPPTFPYMKIPAYALLGAVSLSLAHSQDFAPQTWFEDISISDQSVQKCYSFHTLPGVLYRVESSSNLVDWTQETELYGLGQNYTLAMHEVSPPTGGATSSTAETLTNVSVLARPSAGNSADLVISWPSLDHESPVTFLLSQASATGWNQLPLFSWLQGTYQFFIRFESSPATPPAETPTLGSLDSAMVAAFQTAIPSINEAIANSTALARNTPIAAESGERKFWRIRYDWTSDLDRDGTPDWAEFERLAAGGTVTVSNDAFDADSNGDGIKDGFQTDTDDDGTSDAEDIVLDDATATYAKHAQPLYALFPINNASPDPIYPSPFDINDKGTVLYANGTWTGGTWTPLAGYSNTEVPLIRAAYINDQGEMIGTRIESADNTSTPGNLAYWPDPKAAYQSLSVNGDHPYIGSFYGSYPPVNRMGFSNSGQILGYDQKKKPDDSYELLGPYLWTLSGNGRTPGKSSTPLYEGGVLDNTHYWGTETGGAISVFSGGTQLTPPYDVRNLMVGPHGELLACFHFDPHDTQVYLNGKWQASKTYGKALALASDGTAIARKGDTGKAPILLNGRWTDMDRYAPEAPSEWASSNTELMEISPNGWVLAKRPTGENTNAFAALLPITVDGIDSSVTPANQEDLSGGVDRTSMAAKEAVTFPKCG